MFDDIGNNEKKVIIVKGKGKETKYAQLLFQMISKIPGYEAPQPINENEYKLMVSKVDEQGQIDTGKIIFFGNGKETEIQGKSINWRYRQFGLSYGWLGNRCVVTANASGISLNKQSEFAEYYNSRVEKFREVLELNEISYSETETYNAADTSIGFDDENKMTDKALKFVKGVPSIIKDRAKKSASDTFEYTRALFERSELWERQYELLVCNFILNGFEQFMRSTDDKVVKDQAIIVYEEKNAEYAHLLYNLIYQYSDYDVIEFTEKMFIDNAKTLSSKNKIIFLGMTESAKERMKALQYRFDEYGMGYGYIANHAFINVEKLKANQRKDFIEHYYQKLDDYNDMETSLKLRVAKTSLSEMKTQNQKLSPLMVPFMALDNVVREIDGTYDLTMYQHQLLLREFVFKGLADFMGGS